MGGRDVVEALRGAGAKAEAVIEALFEDAEAGEGEGFSVVGLGEGVGREARGQALFAGDEAGGDGRDGA